MPSIYLYTNSFLYFLFSVWCLAKMKGSSEFLGYSFLNNSGKVEYLTIYTGLQLGFAIFLAIAAYMPVFRLTGIVFCVALYSGIILTRTLSGIFYGNLSKATFIVGALEYSLCAWGIVTLMMMLKESGEV